MADDDLDELPIIRPEIKRKKQTDPALSFSRSVLNRSSGFEKKKRQGSTNRGGHPLRGKSAAATKTPGKFDRRVLIKARVVKMSSQGKKAMLLHINYIERDGVEKDGSSGQLFGPDPSFNRDEFIRPIESENHQLRFIVSPEEAHDLELKEFTRTLMGQVQKDLGRSIEWAAVNHYNTDNPHTHIVVRGVDLKGKELRIDRQYISNGIRHRAAQLSTQWLGQRTVLEIEEQLKQEVRKERLTSLDHQIGKCIEGDQFSLQMYRDKGSTWVPEKQIHSRLDTLEKLGLANQVGHQAWQLKRDWQSVLKQMGERGDIIKGMYRKLGGDTGRYRLYDKQAKESEVVQGRIVDKGLSDELYDKQYVTIESPNGKAWHVELDAHLSIKDYQIDDVVSIQAKTESWLKPADRHIAEIAQLNGGVYTAQAHLNYLDKEVLEIQGQQVAKKDFVNAHVKRLERLARFELATERLDGSWQVADNLVERLNQLDQQKPQRKLSIQVDSTMSLKEQENYVGRTWLDRFTDQANQPVLSGQGFGAQVNQAVRHRIDFLKTLNVDPSDPRRAVELDRLQRQAVQSFQAEQTGRKSVSLNDKDVLKGTLVGLAPEKNGKRFVRLDSTDGRSFALLPWHRSHERSLSKEVSAGLNAEGRTWVKVQGRGQDKDRDR